MSNSSSITLTMGTKQLVVHDAFETTMSFSGSKSSSLTPMTKVASASPDGAEMMTRLHRAAQMAGGGLPAGEDPRGLDHQVDPERGPGQLTSGSRSAMTRMCRSPTSRSLPSTSTGTGSRPWVES